MKNSDRILMLEEAVEYLLEQISYKDEFQDEFLNDRINEIETLLLSK